jgi:hypothetical protein
MERQPNQFDILALQINQGNLEAKEKLRKLLLPGICLIVRHTLRSGNVRSVLGRQVFHAFRRVTSQVVLPGTKIPSALIEMAARRVSDEIVEGLAQQSNGMESLKETVLV